MYCILYYDSNKTNLHDSYSKFEAKHFCLLKKQLHYYKTYDQHRHSLLAVKV